MSTEIQLKHAIQNLTSDFEQFRSAVQAQFVMLRSIVYSGGNVDAQGNQLPNPVLSAKQTVLPSGEALMQYQRGEIYESMTFPNEYVRVKNSVVVERYDVARNIFTDFDYRKYTSSSFSSYYSPLPERDQTQFLTGRSALETSALPETDEQCRELCAAHQNLFFVDEQLETRTVSVPALNSVNIFENENCRDITLSNCSNICFSPGAEYVDINLVNCSCVYFIGGAKHIYMEEVRKGVLYSSANLSLRDLDYVYIQSQVSQFGKLQHDGGKYLIVYKNSCNGSTLRFKGQTIIGPYSLNYANLNILNNINFTISIYGESYNNNQGALNYAKAELNCARDANIVLTPGCCNYGRLVCPAGSFHEGSLYFRNGQYYSANYQQNIVFNKEIKTFFMRKQFKDIEIVSPTISIIEKRTHNGPFDEWYILQSLRLNKFLKKDNAYYGYACTDYDHQIYDAWGQITGQESATSYLIITVGGEPVQVSFSDVNDIQYQGLKTSTFTVKELNLVLGATTYDISDIKINGITILNKWDPYEAKIHVNLNNTGDLFLRLFNKQGDNKNTVSFSINEIIIDGEQQENATFDIDIGDTPKNLLKHISVPEDLIRKIETVKSSLFQDAMECTGLFPWFKNLKHIGTSAFTNAFISGAQNTTLRAEDMAEGACRGMVVQIGESDCTWSGIFEIKGKDVFYGLRVQGENKLHLNFTLSGEKPYDEIFRGAQIGSFTLNDPYILTCPYAFYQSAIQNLYCGQGVDHEVSYEPADAVFAESALGSYPQAVSTKFQHLGVEWFKNCTSFQLVGANIGSIPRSCFEGCTALSDVQDNSITSLDVRAFFGCSSLTTLTTFSVTSFGNQCLAETSIAGFTISSATVKLEQNILEHNLQTARVKYRLSTYAQGFEYADAEVEMDNESAKEQFQQVKRQHPNEYANVDVV